MKTAEWIDNTEIDAEWHLIATDDPADGYCGYTVRCDLTIAGHTESVEVEGWTLQGFLPPGANQNHDGAAFLGGPFGGGWRVCDSDLQNSGRVRVEKGERVINFFGEQVKDIDLDKFPAVNEALAKILAEAGENKEELREEFFSALFDVCMTDIGKECPIEPPSMIPTAQEVFHYLDPLERYDEEGYIYHVRIGDYRGCGLCLAWKTKAGQYDYTYWPDEKDIQRAIAESQDTSDEDIADALRLGIKQYDE